MTPLLPRRRTLLALAATAVIAGATACGTQNTASTSTASIKTTSPDAASTSTHVGAPTAPGTATTSVTTNGTEVTTIGNEKITVPGGKPTALFFFSVGCGECAGGAKALASASSGLNSTANVLAVDMDPGESPQTIQQFLASINAPGLPAAIDTGAVLSQTYQVAALSTLIVVDPAGHVTYRATDPAADAIRTALTHAATQR